MFAGREYKNYLQAVKMNPNVYFSNTFIFLGENRFGDPKEIESEVMKKLTDNKKIAVGFYRAVEGLYFISTVRLEYDAFEKAFFSMMESYCNFVCEGEAVTFAMYAYELYSRCFDEGYEYHYGTLGADLAMFKTYVFASADNISPKILPRADITDIIEDAMIEQDHSYNLLWNMLQRGDVKSYMYNAYVRFMNSVLFNVQKDCLCLPDGTKHYIR